MQDLRAKGLSVSLIWLDCLISLSSSSSSRTSTARCASTGQLRSSAELDDARVELLVRQGDVSQRILEQEQEADCDLIVIGKHGKDAIEELLLGRVTRHVLTEAQGDILVSL